MLNLHLAALYIGLASAVGQVMIIREAMVAFSGNELTLSLIMACWFLGVFSGSAAGSRAAARRPVTASAAGVAALGFSILGIFLAARTARSWLSITAGSVAGFPSIVTGCAALTLPVSFVVGFCFPAMAAAYKAAVVDRENSDDRKQGPSGIGLVYTIEAVGATAGGFAYTFLLAGVVSHGVVSGVLGFLGIWAAMLLLTSPRPFPGHCKKSPIPAKSLSPGSVAGAGATFLMAITLGVIVGGPFETYTENLRWKTIGSGLPMVRAIETRYQNAVLTSQSGLNSIYCDGSYSFSFPEPYQASETAALPLTLHPDPQRVLLIGDGSQELVPQVFDFLNQTKGEGNFTITLVPFDPRVHDLYMEFAPEEVRKRLDRPEVSVNSGDGRLFVKECPGGYDIAILNLPEPSSIMTNRYFTAEFYGEVKRALNPGGIVMTAVSSTVNYMGGDVAEYCGSAVRTLRSVFREVRVIPGTIARVFATDGTGILKLSPEFLEGRYRGKNFSSPYFDPAMFYSMVEEDKVRWFEESLGDLSGFDINTDGRPIAYLKHLKIWERMTTGAGSTRGQGFVSILGLLWPWILGISGLFICISGFMARVPHREKTSFASGEGANAESVKPDALSGRSEIPFGTFGPMSVTLTAGFSSMATQIGVIAMYQSIFGYLYSAIGAINAVFMAGLVAGGAISAVNGKRWIVRADLLALGVPLLAMALPAAGSGMIAQAAFVALIALSGFATGLVLPAAGHFIDAAGADGSSAEPVITEASAASRLECADHAGAMAGALLMGLALIPAAGMTGALLAVAAFKASTLPWSIRTYRGDK